MNIRINSRPEDKISVKVRQNDYLKKPFIAIWIGDLTLILANSDSTNVKTSRELGEALIAAADEAEAQMKADEA